jgi:hypothetical protein
MLHWHYVGHFDPRDPVDTTVMPYRPRVVRPISEAAVERALRSFGEDVAEFVSYYPEGYVCCNWSVAPARRWQSVHRFAYALAQAEGAVLMSERYIVEFPPAARQAQQATWDREQRKKYGQKG